MRLEFVVVSQEFPWYAPKAVRIRLGGVACFSPNGQPLPGHTLHQVAGLNIRTSPPPTLPATPVPAATAAEPGPTGPQQQQPPPQLHLPPLPQQPLLPVPPPAHQPPPPPQRPHPPPQQPEQQQQFWFWESEVLPVQSKTDRLQRFAIPPTLCVGGFLRVDLLGRTQRQAADDRFYSE